MKQNYSCISRWGLKTLSAAVLALAIAAPAYADEYRKSWDFTKWSSETVNNLKAANAAGNGGAANTREWSDVEKSADTTPTDISKDNCFWEWGKQGSSTEDKFLTANGTVIAELEGLYYTETGGGALAIAVNYPETSLGTYNGPSYLWLGGSKKNYFVIPHVAPGTEIKIGLESHKPAEARGVELYVGRGSGTTGTKLLDPEGNAVAVPTTYQDLVWFVPEELTETPNEDGTYDIRIYNTNGCHLYYITVGDGDGGEIEEAKKIAVISPKGEEDGLYFAVQEGFEPTFLTDATDVTLESLQEYEAILVSNAVTADSPWANVLRSAVAYQPMVNLSAELVQAWGLGSVAQSETNIANVTEANLDNALFANLTVEEGLDLVAEGVLPYVTPGEYLANDDVLATVGDKPYIFVHNANRNAHILIPFNAGASTEGETMTGLIANALNVAAKSKKAVTKTATPTFSAEQGNLVTVVTINGAGVVRYALGADAVVTAESPVYTEPLTFTEETMIKAYALQDGYLDSDVATYEVAIAAKAERPVITVTPGEGKSAVITLTAQEGAEIHYSFMGQAESSRTNAAQTAVYTEPVTVYEPTVVYAFATGEGLLASDLEEMNVAIPGIDASNIRLDVVSHFTGGTEWRSPKLDGVAVDGAPLAANVYMGVVKNGTDFGVGSNYSVAWSRYTDQLLQEEIKEQAKNEDGSLQVDENGEPVMVTVQKAVYAVNPESRHELTCDGEADWKYISEGQAGLMETGLANDSWVVTGETKGFTEATDLVSTAPTKGGLSWKGVGKSNNLSDDVSGRLESTVAFAAPFDIDIFLASSGSQGSVDVCISTDGQNWEKVATALGGPQKRNIKKTHLSVEKEGNFYVCVNNPKNTPQLNDVIILNNGEESKKYTGEFTGLEEIADEAAEVISVEYYNLSGMRIAEPENGFCIMRAVLSNGKVVVKKIVK